jgi:branched-chain amino acid transport system ATP-binding protein
MLEVKNLSIKFGGLTAIKDLSFRVNKEEIFAIIGPNGAGKTSLFNVISGIYSPNEGEIYIDGLETSKVWNKKDYLKLAITAVFSASLFILLFNLNSFWKSANFNLTNLEKNFSWVEAKNNVVAFFFDLPAVYSFFPFTLILLLSSIGYLIFWSSRKRSSDHIARLGVGRTFQNIRVFKGLSVLENLLIVLEATGNNSSNNRDRAYETLKFIGLEEYKDFLPNNLSYGHQRRLEIARAIVGSPKILLLDEPAAGMNPNEGRELVNLIKKIKELGITVILIEHHMKVVMDVSDRIMVLNYGNKIAEGSPEEIRKNSKVIEAYLGGSEL